MTSIAIFGGGVAGLSAAHELIDRHYDVTVYEARDIPGGKARSIRLPGTGTGGRADLPAEHGFRFFPGFYKHITDTMRRIPYAGNANGVLDNLVDAKGFQLAREGASDPVFLADLPSTPAQWIETLVTFANANLGVPLDEAAFFASRLGTLLGSCEARRLGQWEKLSWWDFIDADGKSEAYRLYLARGLTRSLVAMRAEEGSTRTVGYVLLQLIRSVLQPDTVLDRLLDGPTNDVWITPWINHLQSQGVDIQFEARASRIDMAGGKISGVEITRPGGVTEMVTADHYIMAMPKERLEPLLTPALLAAEPRLMGLSQLKTEWMNGLMFYLKHDVKLVRGHTIYPNSKWALTSVSQQQFWDEEDLADMGDGTIRGLLSVDISDWTSPGVLYGKRADELEDRQKVKDEVWAQLKLALNDDATMDLLDANLSHWYLDEDIVMPAPGGGASNEEPLLVNTVGSWEHRPEAVTSVPNLFLASDYVRTYTDLATMEGANEAARRAVNGILDATGGTAARCEVWPFEEAALWKPLQRWDELRWSQGKAPLGAPDLKP